MAVIRARHGKDVSWGQQRSQGLDTGANLDVHALAAVQGSGRYLVEACLLQRCLCACWHLQPQPRPCRLLLPGAATHPVGGAAGVMHTAWPGPGWLSSCRLRRSMHSLQVARVMQRLALVEEKLQLSADLDALLSTQP